MFILRLFCLTLSVIVYDFAAARTHNGPFHGNAIRFPTIPVIRAPETPAVSRNGTELPPYSTVYYFDQLIDHNNPRLGTFKQRYWHTYEFYEPGGPIILSTPGESNAQGKSIRKSSTRIRTHPLPGFVSYLTNMTINGVLAQNLNGAAVLLEHRFYGLSNPYPDLTAKSLRVHTIQQAIDDLEYFAKNVNLPMPNGDQLTPDKAPWILVGGSYAGALTSWTMVNKPGLFHAGYASSAVVEAITNFWEYFEPIRQNMPANCSADVQAVIAHIDRVFSGRNVTAIQAIKNNFDLDGLSHLDDVVGALRNNLWDWQSLQVTSGPRALFYRFCDALEVKDGKVAPASGWGAENALAAWGKFWRDFYYRDLCGDDDPETCLGTYDPSIDYFKNTAVNNPNRSWYWIVCNEVGYLQAAAPRGRSSLVSRLITPDYDYRQCQNMFPEAFPRARPPQTWFTNLKYRGWDVRVNRLFFANGERDPWRYATLSVGNGNQFPSRPSQPIRMGEGFHCSDLGTSAGRVDPSIGKVQQDAVSYMKEWMKEFRPSRGPSTPRPRSLWGPSVVPSTPVYKPHRPVNAWFKRIGQL